MKTIGKIFISTLLYLLIFIGCFFTMLSSLRYAFGNKTELITVYTNMLPILFLGIILLIILSLIIKKSMLVSSGILATLFCSIHTCATQFSGIPVSSEIFFFIFYIFTFIILVSEYIKRNPIIDKTKVLDRFNQYKVEFILYGLLFIPIFLSESFPLWVAVKVNVFAYILPLCFFIIIQYYSKRSFLLISTIFTSIIVGTRISTYSSELDWILREVSGVYPIELLDETKPVSNFTYIVTISIMILLLLISIILEFKNRKINKI